MKIPPGVLLKAEEDVENLAQNGDKSRNKQKGEKRNKTPQLETYTQETFVDVDGSIAVDKMNIKVEPMSDEEPSSTVSGSAPEEVKTKMTKRQRRKQKKDGLLTS